MQGSEVSHAELTRNELRIQLAELAIPALAADSSPQGLERGLARLMQDAIVVEPVDELPSRAVERTINGGTRIRRLSNVVFNWPRVATAAADAVVQGIVAHDMPRAFWFLKAVQLFLSLKKALDIPIPDRLGLFYWALWENRELVGNQIKPADALERTREEFARAGWGELGAQEFGASLRALERLHCLEASPGWIRLFETAEVQIQGRG